MLLAVLAAPAFADTIELTSGEKLIGKIITEGDKAIVFESAGLGKLEIPRDRIQRLARDAAAAKAVPVPGAQEPKPPTEPGTAGAQVAAAEPPKKDKQADLLRMYWDEGLRYQISQPITVPIPFTGGERVIGEEVSVSGRIGLRLSMDAATFDSSRGQQDVPSDTSIRTFRLYTTGELGLAGRTLYAVQFGSVGGDFYLHEASLRRPGVEYIGDVTFGYFGVPQTLENIYPFGSLTFMEGALPSLAFAPGNRMGLQFDRTYQDQRVMTTVALFSVGADPGLNFGDASQSLLRPTARVTGLPILDDAGKRHRLLHLGTSISYVLTNDEIQYRARPESFLAPYLVDTGIIKANSAFIGGLEALYVDGPLTVQSEVVTSRVEGDGIHYTFDGYYASVSWFLTGEERPYDKKAGSIMRIEPKVDFSWENKTWGAWEVGLRYSHLDLNSGPIRGGEMGISSVGLNWWWSRYVRWQFDYGFAHVQEGPSPGNLQIFQTRLQLMY